MNLAVKAFRKIPRNNMVKVELFQVRIRERTPSKGGKRAEDNVKIGTTAYRIGVCFENRATAWIATKEIR